MVFRSINLGLLSWSYQLISFLNCFLFFLDRLAEKCIIKMDKENSKIKFDMRVKNLVHREFVIPYMENEVIRCPLISSKMNRPTLKSSAKFLSEVFSNFAQSSKEATIWLFDTSVRFKSFIEKDAANYYEVPSTSFTYRATDFSTYNYIRPLSITCNIKDVKSFVEFGCHQNQLINTYFQSNSNPIEFNFTCTSDSYLARVVLATFDFDSSHQPQPPPFNPSQRSSHPSQQTCTTLNYSMSSSSMADQNHHQQTTIQNDSVNFSMNSASISTNHLSENINEIIENLPDFANTDDSSEPMDYIIDFEGSQLREYHRRFLYGLDSQEKPPVNPADLETIVSESEEEI